MKLWWNPPIGPDDDRVITGVDRWCSVAFWSARGERNREYYYSNHYGLRWRRVADTMCNVYTVAWIPLPRQRDSRQYVVITGPGHSHSPVTGYPEKSVILQNNNNDKWTILGFGIHSAPAIKICARRTFIKYTLNVSKMFVDTFKQTQKNNTLNTV